MLRTTLALALSFSVAIPAAGQTAKTVWPDEGPRTWAPRPTGPAITANDLRTRLYQISDDSMMGRRIGELGNYKVTTYIAAEFKRMGLKPAGDNGGYFQTLDFGLATFDASASRLVAAGASYAVKSEWIPVAPTAANGFAAKVDIDGAQTVFAGRWRDTTALDPAQFKGKVAVFTSTGAASGIVPAGRGTTRVLRCDSVPNKFGADAAARVEAAVAAESAAGRGGRGGGGGRGGAAARDTRAQQAGALAVLIVMTDSIPAAAVTAAFNGRGIMESSVPVPGAGAIGTGAVTAQAAERLFGKPLAQLAIGATGQAVSARWNFEWRISKTPARNVVAIMPGSDPARAGEYVLVSAHNDHNGVNPMAVDHDSLRAVNIVTRPQGTNDPVCRPTEAQQQRIDALIAHARSIRPPRRDSIMNGADDDGSGTALLMEIAEKFAHEKPARSIIFVSHTGEEAGLLGSKWFTDHPTIPLDSVAAALNMDMEGKGRADQVKFGGPTSVQTLGARRLSREFGDIIDSVNATRSETMAIDRSWDVPANPMRRFCRSDQVNYVHHDVPVTYFSTGYAEDYHQVTDEPQYIDYDHAARIARFVHDIAWAIAERKDRPAISGNDPAYPICK
ncbi:MAG TPA: M28 family peptidase [Gemmatimonadaceae bacterium]|jgi:Zn-dependent M28 family amino/carboxypeptidase